MPLTASSPSPLRDWASAAFNADSARSFNALWLARPCSVFRSSVCPFFCTLSVALSNESCMEMSALELESAKP